VVITDPTKYRRIADHHIERLIHKYNPADQEIVQECTNMLSAQETPVAAWGIAYDNIKIETVTGSGNAGLKMELPVY